MKHYFKTAAIFCLASVIGLASCKDDNEKEPDALSVSPKEQVAMSSDGGTQELNITTNAKWRVTGATAWCKVTPAEGEGSATLTITVSANETATARKATLIVQAGALKETLKLEQEGKSVLTPDKTVLTFDYTEGKQALELEASAAWEATVDQTWCRLNKNSGEGAEVLEVMVDENEATEAREAVITFKMGTMTTTVKVSQKEVNLANILATERAALMEFYRAANGNDWENKDGWGKENVPVEEWEGISTYDDGRVKSIIFKEPNNMGGLNGGSLSPEIGKLKKLQKLVIKTGNFQKTKLPETIGELKELKELTLTALMMNGELPASLFNLKNLTVLELQNNSFSGNLPERLSELTELTVLNFDRNSFEGTIPESWKSLTKLTRITLSYDKGLTGPIDVIYSLKALEYVYMNDCTFSGELKKEITGLTNLVRLNLSNNNLTGNLPAELPAMPKLEKVYVEGNRMSGEVPQSILDWNVYDWTSKYDWRNIFSQQPGYGFSNAPANPEND